MKTVLYIDDDKDDLFLFENACRIAAVCFQWKVARGGAEGMRLLSGEQPHPDSPLSCRADFVLLDIKMPGQDGFEVLRWMRAHVPNHLPVALFSSSLQEADIKRGFDLGSTYFIPKFGEFSKLIGFLQVLDQCLRLQNFEVLRGFSVSPAENPVASPRVTL